MPNLMALLVFDDGAKFSLFFNFDDRNCIEFSMGGAIETAHSMSFAIEYALSIAPLIEENCKFTIGFFT